MVSSFLSSPHKHIGTSVQKLMLKVGVTLIPAILCYIWFFGIGIVIQCLLCVCFALLFEFLMLKLRKQPIKLFLFDGSAIITGLLFALCISPFSLVG